MDNNNTIICRHEHTIASYDNGFVIANYTSDTSPKRFTALGYGLPQEPGVTVELTGQWEYDRYNGGQHLRVDTHRIELPTDDKNITAYLRSLHCGIGEKTANILVDKYGTDLWTIIENNPEQIHTIKGCKRVDIEKLSEKYRETIQLRDLLPMFAGTSASFDALAKLIEKMKGKAVEKIKENPYVICRYGFSFYDAEQVAAQIGYDRTNKARVEAAVIVALRQGESQGHTCLSMPNVIAAVQDILSKAVDMCPSNVPLELSNNAIQMIIINMSDMDIKYDKDLYRRFRYDEEDIIALRVAHITKGKIKPSDHIDEYIDDYEKENNITLDPIQREAIREALSHPMHIITGCAGTGKSTVIKGILYCHARIKAEFHVEPVSMLMAPTGRAARRMKEITGEPATTIHRALKIKSTDEDDDSDCKALDADIVIVDEASMLDNHVASILFCAIQSETKLILVGDPAQLPSVGCGNVLQDIINSGAVTVTNLARVYRQGDGSAVINNAIKIRAGENNLAYDNKEFAFVYAPGPSHCINAGVTMYLKCIEQAGGDPDKVILLTPYREKGVCVDEYNAKIQEAINPPAPNKKEYKRGQTVYREGDVVMQTKNTDVVVNGDIGRIVKIETEKNDQGKDIMICTIDFPTAGPLRYEPKDMDHIVLAYCSTIHKAQGNEWDTVILVLHDSHGKMLQRNLIYTGVTRAVNRVCIIGTESAINKAIQTNDTVVRNTHLAERIKEEKGKGIPDWVDPETMGEESF